SPSLYILSSSSSNATSPTHLYTLSLHDALPISTNPGEKGRKFHFVFAACNTSSVSISSFSKISESSFINAILISRCVFSIIFARSEEHTSELQSRFDLVCRLLLEKKNKIYITIL